MNGRDSHAARDEDVRNEQLARCEALMSLAEEAAHTYILAVVRSAPPDIVAMARRAWQDAVTALIAAVKALVPE